MRERCEPECVREMARVRDRGAQLPRSDGVDHRRSSRKRARGRAPVRDRRQWRDLLRPRRDRAQPGFDHGHGDREPRDGDRQHRPRRGGRESVARTEQRAGFVRHGVVPARVSGLSPRERHGRAHPVRTGLARDAAVRAGTAHPQYVRSGARRRLQGAVHPGRGHRAVRSEHAARDRGADGDGMHHRAGPVSQRNRQVRPRVPAGFVVPGKGRHLHQCRATHIAGAQGDALEVRLCRLGDHAAAVQCDGAADELPASVARSWTRSRA